MPATTARHPAASAARRRRALAAVLLLALAGPPASTTASAQPQEERIGTSADPVVRSVELERARLAAVGGQPAVRVVLGRADVFADTLTATALAGADGALLLTDGGAGAGLRPEVADQLTRSLADGGCEGGTGPTAYLVGGEAALSAAVEADVRAAVDGCVVRLAGADRVATGIEVAARVPEPSGAVVLARADDPADAGAVGAWAAATRSRVLVTAGEALDPRVADALQRLDPDQVVLVGGPAALSEDVASAAAEVAPTRRVAGPTRDGTAVAIGEQLWGPDTAGRALAEGHAEDAWTTLFAGAPLAAARRTPILLTADGVATPATQGHLDDVRPAVLLRLGPPPVAEPDLARVRAALVPVATLDAPLMLKARPGSDELWVAERAGRVVALAPDGSTRTVLDIAATVSSDGERGLLGLAFSPEGTTLYTSSTDRDGHSVVDAFAVAGDAVDAGSRREVIQVDQPAANHNGGDLQVGPDGHLWWSLGDGGGAGDTFGNGQRADTLLGTIVRLDPDGATPYAIPADNPFVAGRTPDGRPARPEVWAYGLRNPFRFDLDEVTGDLYVADVGQGAVEEVDHLPGRDGAVPVGGANFGWNVWEGTRRFADGDAPGHVPPVWEQVHDDGHCAITGGVLYRGTALPDLVGAYLYSDLCDPSVEAVVVRDGRVVQSADLGGDAGTPVGFGTDHAGEVLVLSLGGQVLRLVPEGPSTAASP